MRTLPIIVVLSCLIPLSGCHEKDKSESGPAYGAVAAYLMPPGKKSIELLMERVKSGPGKRTLRQPRRMQEVRTDRGVVYRVLEKVSEDEWRTTAQLFLDARPDGAWIAKQFNLHGKRVGPRRPRLVFAWPLSKGKKERKFSYPIFGRRQDGGRKVGARVRTLRTGFHEQIGGKRYGPCLEVQETLKPDVGGRLILKSVFCRGLGRVRIRQENHTLSRGLSIIDDHAIGVRETGK